MSKKKAVVPDAWDDDWESQADREEPTAAANSDEQQVKVSKAERLARHADQNKKIWQSAETPETFHFLAARSDPPLKTEFKPALQVLSRKPVIARPDSVTGMSRMTIDDEEEENEATKNRPSPEELRLKAQRDREEKQKRYEEARARLFGTPDASGASASQGNIATASADDGKRNRGKNRSRGGRAQDDRRPGSQPRTGELYDPEYSPKPGSITLQKREGEITRSGRSTPREEDLVIRAPRGPDASGKGFTSRGGKAG